MHLVEGVGEAELLDRSGHSGGHDAAHATALDHQCDTATVVALAW